LDRRYKENEGASNRSERRSNALSRARLRRARVGARSVTADDSGATGRGESNMALTIRNQARGQERRGSQQLFNEEGSGTYGAGISFEDARRGIKMGEGLIGLR